METKPTGVADADAEAASVPASPPPPPLPQRARQTLPPKGSCWYCEKPLDSVRRFCGRDCADAFDEEDAFR